MADDDESSLPSWPDVPRLAFGPGAEAQLNACVSSALWNPNDMAPYITGYRRGAEVLFEHVEGGGAPPDFTLLPIAFLWRHCIELSLKEIIALGRCMDGEPWSFPEHHRLGELWRTAKPYVITCGPANAPEIGNVESNIAEFEKIDPSAQGFRYSLNRAGDRSLNAPDLVNLRGLHDAMVPLANFLSGVSSVLQDRLDSRARE